MKYYIDEEIKVKGNIFPMERFIRWEEDTYDVLGSIFLDKIKEIDQSGEIRVLEDECRIDNIAHKHMRSTDFWWLLMEYNDIINFDVKSNESLKIPSETSIISKYNEMILKRNYNRI